MTRSPKVCTKRMKPRPGARIRRLYEQPGDDAAELSEKRAAVSEERPDELLNGEDISPMWNGPQHAR